MRIDNRPYEILIRFAVQGGVQGAQCKYRQIAVDDDGTILVDPSGKRLLDHIEQAKSISLGGPEMADILGQALVDMAGEVRAREMDIVNLNNQIKSFQTQVESLRSQLAKATSITE